MSGPVIRAFRREDAAQAAELEKLCFSDPWSAEGLRSEAENPFTAALAAELDGKLAGYVFMTQDDGNGYISNVAVSPDKRRAGVASALMRTLLEESRRLGVRSIVLDVRRSNEAAISFYRGFGFKDAGERKGFYRSPDEDSLIMLLTEV